MEDIYIDLRVQNVWIQREFENQDFASVSELIGKIEDLRDKLEETKKEYEEFKENVKTNYRQIPVAEQVGISDSDFI